MRIPFERKRVVSVTGGERPSGPVRVLLAGHTSLDIIPDLSQLANGFQSFTPGNLIDIEATRLSTGGAVLNTGLALHKLGVATRLVVKVGNDPWAALLRSMVHQTLEGGISEAQFLTTNEAPTCSVVVLNPKDSDRMFLHCPGANQTFSAADITDDMFGCVDIFHLGYPPLLRRFYLDGGTELAGVFRRAKTKGVVTSLDMAMPDANGESGKVPWWEFFARVLPEVDILMPSVEESLFMVKRERFEEIRRHGGDFTTHLTAEDLAELAAIFLNLGVKVVGLKLGEQGLYVRTNAMSSRGGLGPTHPVWWQNMCRGGAWDHREVLVPCFKVKVAGTTGSGDCTVAGFLTAVSKGFSLEESMIAAVGVGACNVEAMDATSGLHPWDDVMDRIQSGWPQSDIHIELSHWVRRSRWYFGPEDSWRKAAQMGEGASL